MHRSASGDEGLGPGTGARSAPVPGKEGLGQGSQAEGLGFSRSSPAAPRRAYADALRLVTAGFKMARFPAKLIDNLKPYYQRRRLSELAKRKREVRATQAVTVPALVATSPRKGATGTSSPARETARVTVSKTVAKWLAKNRIFGT